MGLKTPTFRVSYPNVMQAKRNDMNGKDEYSVVALFSKDTDLSEIKAAIKAAIEKKWPNPKTRPSNIRTPLRDQGERAKDGKLPMGYEDGAMMVNLKSVQRPQLVDQKVQPITDPSEFYAGCYAIASVNVFAYDQKGNRGVSIGLGNIQKVKDGDPLGGRTRATDDFAPISNESASADANSLFT